MNRLPFQQLLPEEENNPGKDIILHNEVRILHISKVGLNEEDKDAGNLIAREISKRNLILHNDIGILHISEIRHGREDKEGIRISKRYFNE